VTVVIWWVMVLFVIPIVFCTGAVFGKHYY